MSEVNTKWPRARTLGCLTGAALLAVLAGASGPDATVGAGASVTAPPVGAGNATTRPHASRTGVSRAPRPNPNGVPVLCAPRAVRSC
jgi:hypothetical protein